MKESAASVGISGRRFTLRGGIVVLPLVLALAVLAGMAPIRQDGSYHEFADQRTVVGIPHFGDVATNLPFILIGALGLGIVARRRFADGPAWIVFFSGVLLTGAGSTWFHLAPDARRLFWDRLPMTLVFMSMFSIVIGERASPRLGRRLLAPLLLAGAASVVYWAWSGDLRFYALVQFYPMLAIPLLLLLYTPRFSHAGTYWAVLGGYALAKACEMLDGPIYRASGAVSGHNLKHVLAAAATASLLWMLRGRQPIENCPPVIS